MTLDQRLQRLWYGPAWRSLPLWPLAALFRLMVPAPPCLPRTDPAAPACRCPGRGRRQHHGRGYRQDSVAGWLAKELSPRGHRVGVVLRGYGGEHRGAPRRGPRTTTDTGDEALLHARRGAHSSSSAPTGSRPVNGRWRRARRLSSVTMACSMRDSRVTMKSRSSMASAGSATAGCCQRVRCVSRRPARSGERRDFHESRSADGQPDPRSGQLALRGPVQLTARLRPGKAVNLLSGERRELATFAGMANLHVVAGIGHPQAFFAGLRAAGLVFEEHSLPDHGRSICRRCRSTRAQRS